MDISRNEISTIHSGKYFQKYLQFAESIISGYKGDEPFHLYLKKYFASNKKHGSKDRKQIASLCYNYFRLGCGVSPRITFKDKFLLGTFLCNSNPSVLLSKFKPGWDEMISCQVNEKVKIAENLFDPKNLFPFQRFLSDEIDYDKFSISFLQQPKLFLRIRPGKEAIVLEKIRSANFSFEKINDNCLVFSHNEKVADVISIDKEAVVQDYNSQRVSELIKLATGNKQQATENIWDCCAGSGGKSILAVDTLKNIKLTVTDNRPSILQNLKKRFAAAGIKNYDLFVLDLSVSVPSPLSEWSMTPMEEEIKGRFDLIIADVPCSGSGTWSRTPEQLTFFKENEIEKYALLQKNIVRNIVPHLQRGGVFLYITCSVFKKENEENVDYILQNFQLDLLHQEYLKGYEMQADTLFAAVFTPKSSKGDLPINMLNG